MNEPTPEQCSSRAKWSDAEFDYVAFWWPQMGGYCAKAIARVLINKEDEDCVQVWVWHKGDFPFTEGERNYEGIPISPAELHICDFEDWAQTMNFLSEFQTGSKMRYL